MVGTLRARKRKYIDYRTEIPFQRQVPAGFYDVEDEKKNSMAASLESKDKDFEVVRLDKMEQKRRDQEESEEARKDRKKLKRMEKMNPAQTIMQISDNNDPMTFRRRTELSLPAPQVSDAELEDVLKIGASAIPDAGSSGGATQVRPLTSHYPLPSPPASRLPTLPAYCHRPYVPPGSTRATQSRLFSLIYDSLTLSFFSFALSLVAGARG